MSTFSKHRGAGDAWINLINVSEDHEPSPLAAVTQSAVPVKDSPPIPPLGALPRFRPKGNVEPIDLDELKDQTFAQSDAIELALLLKTDFESRIRGSFILGISVDGFWFDWFDNYMTLKVLAQRYNAALKTAKDIGWPGGSDPLEAQGKLNEAIGLLRSANEMMTEAHELAKSAGKLGPHLREALPDILYRVECAWAILTEKDEMMDTVKLEVGRLT